MRVRSALHRLVEEIADGLIQEIKNHSLVDDHGEFKAADEFASIVAKGVAMEVTGRLSMPTTGVASSGHGVDDRLAALENRLEKLTKGSRESSKGDPETSLPNLKYAKSKYQNVESLLNYIETKETEGGIKLVIMNFND